MMSSGDFLSLLAFLAFNMVAALSGAFFKPGPWYEGLRKPAWRPPNWLFPPAWSVLYLLNAVAGWLVWRTDGLSAMWELFLYLVSLGLNAGWSFVFFGLRRPDLAFFHLVLLWVSIAATILVFAPLQSTAALILLPYLAWVTFAGALNAAIWRLNGGKPGMNKVAG